MVRVMVQVETKKMITGLPQLLVGLTCFISATAPLSILNHEVNPPLVANCSTTVLTCQVDTPAPAVDVWWTFRGENASKLPNVNIVTDRADDGIWQLQLLCPTPEHAGSFACNAQSRNESELVYRKEETVDVYVPIFIEVEETNSSNLVGTKVELQCLVTAFPKATIQWEKDGQALKVEKGHQVDIQTTQISEVVVFGSVTIDVLKREDNGTYTCLASNAYNMSRSTQDITVLEPPEVSLDSLEAKDPRTASLSWHVRYRGNLPVKRFHLQVRNFSTGADWLDVDNNIEANLSVYTVRYLSPAMTYSFQLAAVNDAGYSDWENLNITMPADVPPRVSWIHVLASTNETLLLGWRRPRHDNGANITHYLVQLHHNGEVIANETMTVMTNPRNNYMYIFVNLEPGEDYIFQVKACSIIGCGNWSEPMEAGTSDGMADPPEHVEIKCLYDAEKDLSYVVVTWEPPANPRGTIQSYNITLESSARYRATNGKTVVDKLAEVHEVKGDTSELKSIVKPNTNYTVRICTKNRSGCGPLSIRTTRTMCSSPPSAPSSMPKFQLQRMKEKHNHKQLKLTLQRISERNGVIRCYRIIIIKLEGGGSLADLPTDPSSLDITTYGEVHRKNGRGAYIAEAINTDSFVSEVIIGDDRYSLCEDTTIDHPASPRVRSRRVTEQPSKKSDILTEYVYDGKLAPKTNYTGFVEVRVIGSNKTIISKQSPYFAPVETGFFPKSEPTENPMAIVLGVLSGLIFVVLILILVLCLFKRKNNDPYDERDRLGLTALIRRTIQRNGHIPRCKSTRLSKTPYLGPIMAEDLPSAYVERHSDSDLLFQSEFEALPEKFKDRSTHASDSPENLSKNRYPDIRSFDQTRVRLPMEDGVAGSDYINADFVEGYKNRKLFICAQGPLDRTVTDFWRMIWEHKVTVIVMLTGVEEHGKIKCAQYWNESEPKEIENLFVVNVITTKIYSDYIVRRFHVQYLKDDYAEEREVLHFHFVMWKDFLAPEQPSWLLRFIKRVNEHYVSDRGPLLVHCSAGVGRTGTFVAIDTLLQQLDEEGQVDVYGCVSNLRHSRNFLVQSLKQYIFVYRALLEHAQFGDTEMEIRHFKDHYEHMKEKVGDQEKTRLELEFEKLGDVIEDPKTCCVGTMDMNMNKNRHNFIIPYDINRVILPPTASRDHSSYINASFIQGYDRSLSFIITQDPLENTVTEFWRMVKEQTITTVVMLSELGEGQTKCQQYWPREEEKEYDYIKVKFQNEETRENITKREFQVINTKNNDNHTLTQFQFLGWSSTIPENTIAFIDLIEKAQQNKEQDPSSGPVTVHCSGGGDRSSIFVTLSVLIQQLKNEERVDVFQAARYTRSQRQCMLKTLAHYEFLYQGILDYIHTYKLYDMGDTPL